MDQRKTVRNWLVFLLILLGVSFFRQITQHFAPVHSLWWSCMPWLVYGTYLGLLLVWLFSISQRMPQVMMRRFLCWQTVSMLFFIVLRLLQETVLYDHIGWMRWTGYWISVPAVLVPLFGCYASFCLGESDEFRIAKHWYGLLIPACILIGLTVTNDSHHFMYRSLPGEAEPNLLFHPNYGIYLLYFWALSLIAMQAAAVYRRNNLVKNAPLMHRLLPFAQPFLIVVYSIPYMLSSFSMKWELMEYSVGLFFICVIVWEFYIYAGIIPVNQRYEEMFQRSTVAMQLLRPDGEVEATSEQAHLLDAAVMRALAQDGQWKDDELHQRLHLYAMSEGLMIWQQDESQLDEMRQELQGVQTELEKESDLLAEEIRVRSEEANLQAKNKLYNHLSAEVQGELQELQRLVESAREVALPAEQMQLWNRIAFLGTYVKRYCNLQLIYHERHEIADLDRRISGQDLYRSFQRLQGDIKREASEQVTLAEEVRALATETCSAEELLCRWKEVAKRVQAHTA